MWNKIDSLDAVTTIHTGDIVSQKPGDIISEFLILHAKDGYICVLHADIAVPPILLPANTLFYDNWWVKNLPDNK
jgi:hypothetical protein